MYSLHLCRLKYTSILDRGAAPGPASQELPGSNLRAQQVCRWTCLLMDVCSACTRCLDRDSVGLVGQALPMPVG